MAKKRGYFRLNLKEILSASGRIDRMTYFIYNICYNVLSVVLGFVVGTGYVVIAEFIGGFSDDIFIAVVFSLVVLPPLYLVFCNAVKRLHDIGLPGLLAIVPIMIGIAYQVIGIHKELPYLPENLAPSALMAEPYLLIASLLIGACLIFIPGIKGANRYGPSTTEYYGGKADLPKPTILEG